MKDLDEIGKKLEMGFGLISGGFIYFLHQNSVLFGSKWDIENDSTIDIIVNKENADFVYSICKEINNGYSVGVSNKLKNKIKQAKKIAHDFLRKEANDPNVKIERKIELVKLTSKQNQ